jgi:translation initiation factor 5A
MDMDTYETFELPIDEELKGQMEPGKEIQYFEALGRKKISKTD